MPVSRTRLHAAMALNLTDLRHVSDQCAVQRASDAPEEGDKQADVPGALAGCMRVASAVLGGRGGDAAPSASSTQGAAAGMLYCTGGWELVKGAEGR